MADLVRKVSDFLDSNNIKDYEAIIIGCSGGPDSVALLHIMSLVVKDKIHCVHVNHNLRPGICDEEQRYVESLCKDLGVPFKAYSFDVKAKSEELGKSEEETGRILRYQVFDEYAREVLGDKNLDKTLVAVAHHKGDLSETMLMNLFRGSGLEGLVSPLPVAGRIIRPLLSCDKKELMNYLVCNSVTYFEDASNMDSDYTRNYYRNEVLPVISKVSVKRPEDALFDAYSLLADDYSYINSQVEKVYEENVVEADGHLLLKVETIRDLHISILSRVIRKLWNDTFGNLTDFEKVNLDSVIELLGHKENSSIDMPFARKAVLALGYIGFSSKENIIHLLTAVSSLNGFCLSEGLVKEYIEEQENAYKMPNSSLHLRVDSFENVAKISYNTHSWFCPLNEVEGRLVITNNALDLSFKRAGSDITKTLKGVLEDKKIPKEVRKNVLVVTDESGKILWIPGFGHAIGFTDEISYEKYVGTHGDDSKLLRIEIGGPYGY